jgi:tol-pal system protein YbgF
VDVARYFAARAHSAYDFAVISARWTWLLLVAGCASPMSSLRDDNRRLNDTVSELRSDRRAQDRKLRDLQHQLDELKTHSSASDVPALPVVIASPGPAATAAPTASAAAAMSPDGARVVGVADDGTEIVYEGDAARMRTAVSPPLPGDDDAVTLRRQAQAPASRRAPASPTAAIPAVSTTTSLSLAPAGATASAAAASASTAAAASLGDVPTASDRIEVTHRVPPISARAQVRKTREHEAPAERSGGDAASDYRAAVDLVKAASYDSALAALRAFIAHYPRHDYADNAQYWIGEVFYAQKDYAHALSEFRKVIEVYPRGNKVPDALLKLGYCYQAMGQGEKARAMLEQVVNRYPKSEPAMLAAKRLEAP